MTDEPYPLPMKRRSLQMTKYKIHKYVSAKASGYLTDIIIIPSLFKCDVKRRCNSNKFWRLYHTGLKSILKLILSRFVINSFNSIDTNFESIRFDFLSS